MEKIHVNNTAVAIFSIATAVVLIGGLALVPAALQKAEAQSEGHSRSCGQAEGIRGCVAPSRNPSNPNSICDDAREFAANLTGGNC